MNPLTSGFPSDIPSLNQTLPLLTTTEITDAGATAALPVMVYSQTSSWAPQVVYVPLDSIQSGRVGPTGPSGATGIPGPTGAPGTATGVSGVPGATGATGASGAQGGVGDNAGVVNYLFSAPDLTSCVQHSEFYGDINITLNNEMSWALVSRVANDGETNVAPMRLAFGIVANTWDVADDVDIITVDLTTGGGVGVPTIAEAIADANFPLYLTGWSCFANAAQSAQSVVHGVIQSPGTSMIIRAGFPTPTETGTFINFPLAGQNFNAGFYLFKSS